MIGQCKLCLQEKVLKNSHYLSQGIYKALRDDGEQNPNPWLISAKSAVQTSKQMTAYLLCDDCEQRFSKRGEDWVLRHCTRNNGNFKLRSILDARTPGISAATEASKVYYASEIPEIDVEALAYFAVSIFWRGSIHPWNDGGSIPVRLGPFQEQLRQYLFGEASFPRDCSLWVAVREGGEVVRLTYAPTGGRDGNCHQYGFSMPGLAFTIFIGKNISDFTRAFCIFRGQGNPIISTPHLENILEDRAIKQFSRVDKRSASNERKADAPRPSTSSGQAYPHKSSENISSEFE